MSSKYITLKISKTRLRLLIALLLFLFLFVFSATFAHFNPMVKTSLKTVASSVQKMPLIGKYIPKDWLPRKPLQEQVLPLKGFQTKIVFGGIIPQMVDAGVIDLEKLEENYKYKDRIPKDIKQLFTKPSNEPILLTEKNNSWLLTILWPFGISNKMKINEKSPIAGKDVGEYASTGGWTLGKEQNGGVYFNSYSFSPLTETQEQRVRNLAENIYRPCCDNSSFFQDCNHGSAALGLIELAVAQGLSDDEIYKTVLYFNSFWFPQNYMETALYFQKVRGLEWEDLNPKVLLSQKYSSITGWTANIDSVARQIPDLVPPIQGGSSC